MVADVSLASAWLASALLDDFSSAVVVREGQEPNDFELFICRVGSKTVLQPSLLQLEIDEEDGERFLDICVITSEGGLCPTRMVFWEARIESSLGAIRACCGAFDLIDKENAESISNK